MKFIPITLRLTPEEIIPVVIRNLLITKNLQIIPNEIGFDYNKCSVSSIKYGKLQEDIIGISPGDLRTNAVKHISVAHEIGLTSTIRPLIISEASLIENSIGVESLPVEAGFSRYRRLSEVDAMTLEDLDTMKLEDVDYLET